MEFIKKKKLPNSTINILVNTTINIIHGVI